MTFLLTSDAHRAEELDRARFASLNAERAWVDPAKVANTWAPERLLKWIDDGRPTRALTAALTVRVWRRRSTARRRRPRCRAR